MTRLKNEHVSGAILAVTFIALLLAIILIAIGLMVTDCDCPKVG